MLFSFDDFNYSLTVDKHELVIKEAMTLTFSLKQKSAKEVMGFDFSIPADDAYIIEAIKSEESKDTRGRIHIKSVYMLYPLKAGKFSITPHLVIKKASKEEVKKFVTGSADELMYLRTRNHDISLGAIDISVKALERDVALVGDYKLSYTIDKKEMDEGEQVNIVYTISGKGYKPQISHLLKDSSDMDIFMDREVFDRKSFHKVVFHYAISGYADFTIPKVSILAYNPDKAKYYTLSSADMHIKVQKNREEKPIMIEEKEQIEWQAYLNYFLLFLAGYMLQKLLKNVPKKPLSKEEVFVLSIKKSKSAKGLLKLLLAEDIKSFKTEIEKLERAIYHDSTYALPKLKADILKRYEKR